MRAGIETSQGQVEPKVGGLALTGVRRLAAKPAPAPG